MVRQRAKTKRVSGSKKKVYISTEDLAPKTVQVSAEEGKLVDMARKHPEVWLGLLSKVKEAEKPKKPALPKDVFKELRKEAEDILSTFEVEVSLLQGAVVFTFEYFVDPLGNLEPTYDDGPKLSLVGDATPREKALFKFVKDYNDDNGYLSDDAYGEAYKAVKKNPEAKDKLKRLKALRKKLVQYEKKYLVNADRFLEKAEYGEPYVHMEEGQTMYKYV